MELIAPDMTSLFAQLGEPNDAASIARFMELNGHMRGHTKLHEAAFWSPSQAAFLRDAIALDANWAPVVDALNAGLHEAAQAAGLQQAGQPATPPL
ncbi:DUF2789 domain-containing protein [Rhodoferax lacus]|uniref:DUF2789 domain-containing protein n=1 Tax=Rhodoferax lacus TaxID=2184758 RepID=A0A3E1RCN0_9BURK|nr:DUF2789 family protein [Rhodoferax lacus]RFO97124.1 DUF2789 domain-containing protein [Rhodoferax lacus]